MPDDRDIPAASSASAAAVAIATQPNATQPPGFWRWTARAVLALWWLFVVALAAGSASYLGNHAGPALIPLLPRLLDWARGQSPAIQAGLILVALAVLAAMACLTVLAWRQRQQRVVQAVQAGIQRQTVAFEGALDLAVHPRLDGIQAGVDQVTVQGETIARQQETLLDVATDTRSAVESLHQEIGDLARRTEHASATRRVFVSGTFVDLRAYRKRLYEALVDMYQLPVDMVDFGTGGGDATKVSKEEVAASDLFVLIVAWRYGVIPIGATKSITEQEYDEAVQLQKPIFVFLADPSTKADDGPDALFPAAVRMPEHAQQLAAFRALLSDPNHHTYKTFTTPEDLALKVQTALYRYLLRTGAIGNDPAGPPFQQAALPLPEKAFVGRQADLDWLLPRLRAGGGETAITAIDGLGGVGKSTLGAVAVHELAAQGVFPDGIAAVDCLGLGRDDAVGVLRGALDGFAHQAAQEAADLAALTTLAMRALTGKRALIVFDNVEPELDIAAVLQRLRPTGVTLLLTARQRLPVPRDALRELALLSETAALDLFAEWYGSANAAALTPGEHAAATCIVRALGRHTLAVKLAAAEAADGVAHLDDRSPDAVAHWLAGFAAEKAAYPLDIQGLDADATQALKDNLMRSVTSLPTTGALGDVRRLFAALAVFNAPVLTSAASAGDARSAATDGSERDRVSLVPSLEFGHQAVVAIATALDLPVPERAVNLLVRRAVLEKSTTTTLPEGADRERLRLHPLLRELAAELLDDATRTAASLAIAVFYAEYTDATPDAALIPDAENIAGALEWAHMHAPGSDRDELVIAICRGAAKIWEVRSLTHMSLRYLPWGIASATRGIDESAASDLESQRQRGDLVSYLYFFYAEALDAIGQRIEALKAWNCSIRYAQWAGAEGRESYALGGMMGSLGRLLLNTSAAEPDFMHVMELGDAGSDGRKSSPDDVLMSLIASLSASDLATLDESIKLFPLGKSLRDELARWAQSAVSITSNVTPEQANMTVNAAVLLAEGDLDGAERTFKDLLADIRASGDPEGDDVILSALGSIAMRQERWEDARKYLLESLTIKKALGDVQGQGKDLLALAKVARGESRHDEAASLIQQCLEAFQAAGADLAYADTVLDVAPYLSRELNHCQDACRLLQKAIAKYASLGSGREQEARELAKRLGCDVGE